MKTLKGTISQKSNLLGTMGSAWVGRDGDKGDKGDPGSAIWRASEQYRTSGSIQTKYLTGKPDTIPQVGDIIVFDDFEVYYISSVGSNNSTVSIVSMGSIIGPQGPKGDPGESGAVTQYYSFTVRADGSLTIPSEMPTPSEIKSSVGSGGELPMIRLRDLGYIDDNHEEELERERMYYELRYARRNYIATPHYALFNTIIPVPVTNDLVYVEIIGVESNENNSVAWSIRKELIPRVNEIGSLNNLTTTSKSDLVAAINEVNGKSEVFTAVYGETTAEEIFQAYAAGKICQLRYNYLTTSNEKVYRLVWCGQRTILGPSGTTVEWAAIFSQDRNNEFTTVEVQGSSWSSPSTVSLAEVRSPVFSGTPKAPTAEAGTDTTQIATTAFVQQEIGSKYTKPSDGIPATDLASDVQTAIDNAIQDPVGFHEGNVLTQTSSGGVSTESWEQVHDISIVAELSLDANDNLSVSEDTTVYRSIGTPYTWQGKQPAVRLTWPDGTERTLILTSFKTGTAYWFACSSDVTDYSLGLLYVSKTRKWNWAYSKSIKYTKPSDGIPNSDLAEDAQRGYTSVTGTVLAQPDVYEFIDDDHEYAALYDFVDPDVFGMEPPASIVVEFDGNTYVIPRHVPFSTDSAIYADNLEFDFSTFPCHVYLALDLESGQISSTADGHVAVIAADSVGDHTFAAYFAVEPITTTPDFDAAVAKSLAEALAKKLGTSGDAYRAASIPMGHLDAGSTATVMTATVPGITELRDGVCMWLQNGVITSEANFTININGLGAKPCYSSLAAATRVTTAFNVNYTMLMVYNSTRVDGGCWDIVYGYETNTTYTPPKLGFGYGTCTTAAATTAKTASISNYTLTTGGIVAIKFSEDVPANATLNITSKGAKAIYYKGAAITAGIIKAGDTATFIYSTNYHLLSIDRWGSDIEDIKTRLDQLLVLDNESF